MAVKVKSDNQLFLNLHQQISASDYGKKLMKEVRYSRYKPENITNSEWEKLLGEDVNNLKH